MKLFLHPCTGIRSPQLLNPIYSVEVIDDSGKHAGCWNVRAKSSHPTESYKVHLIMKSLPAYDIN